jgi:hypothetical protein
MKKLTVPVAKALANQVKNRIEEAQRANVEAVKKSYQSSKEYKAYKKAVDDEKAVIKAAAQKVQDTKAAFVKAFTTKDVQVTGFGYSRDEQGYYTPNFQAAGKNVDVEDLKDRILVEHFQNEAGETSEQIIDRLVKELSK